MSISLFEAAAVCDALREKYETHSDKIAIDIHPPPGALNGSYSIKVSGPDDPACWSLFRTVMKDASTLAGQKLIGCFIGVGDEELARMRQRKFEKDVDRDIKGGIAEQIRSARPLRLKKGP